MWRAGTLAIKGGERFCALLRLTEIFFLKAFAYRVKQNSSNCSKISQDVDIVHSRRSRDSKWQHMPHKVE